MGEGGGGASSSKGGASGQGAVGAADGRAPEKGGNSSGDASTDQGAGGARLALDSGPEAAVDAGLTRSGSTDGAFDASGLRDGRAQDAQVGDCPAGVYRVPVKGVVQYCTENDTLYYDETISITVSDGVARVSGHTMFASGDGGSNYSADGLSGSYPERSPGVFEQSTYWNPYFACGQVMAFLGDISGSNVPNSGGDADVKVRVDCQNRLVTVKVLCRADWPADGCSPDYQEDLTGTLHF
jgi:hypothetical protein